jgi:hypothetical protein
MLCLSGQVLLALAAAAVVDGLLLLQEAEEVLRLRLCHQVLLLLEWVPVVVALVPVAVVVVLRLEPGELVCFLQLVLWLHFWTLQ